MTYPSDADLYFQSLFMDTLPAVQNRLLHDAVQKAKSAAEAAVRQSRQSLQPHQLPQRDSNLSISVPKPRLRATTHPFMPSRSFMYPVSYPVASPILPPIRYHPPYLLGLRNYRARISAAVKQEEKKKLSTAPAASATDNSDMNDLAKEMDALYAEFDKEFETPLVDLDKEFKALSADLDRELDEMFEAGYKQRDGESKAPVSKPVTTPTPAPAVQPTPVAQPTPVIQPTPIVQPTPVPVPTVRPTPVAQPTPGVKPTPIVKVEPLVTTPPPGFATTRGSESPPPRPKSPVVVSPVTSTEGRRAVSHEDDYTDDDDELAEPGLALSPLRDNGLVEQRMRSGSCPFAVAEFFYVPGESPKIRADMTLYYDGHHDHTSKVRYLKRFNLNNFKRTVTLYTRDTDELLDGAADLLAYDEAGEYNLRHPDGVDTLLQDLKDLTLANDRVVCLSTSFGAIRFRCQVTTVHPARSN